MNTATLLLGAIILIPILLLMALRVNAVLVFLSLCLGDVLVQFMSNGTNFLMSFFASAHTMQNFIGGGSGVKLVLLLAPPLLTLLVMIHTVKGTRLVLNILPSIAVGLLGSLLIVPLLSNNTSQGILANQYWDQLQRAQVLVVGGSALVCLLLLWMQRTKASKKEKHSKHGE